MRKNHQTGSVRNLATMNDHACLYPSSAPQLIERSPAASAALSDRMRSSSSRETRFDLSGSSKNGSHSSSHPKPMTPMNTNAARQPQAAAIGGMMAGATIAPTFAPE